MMTAYEFGAFSLAFATFTAGLDLARAQHPERCARVSAASLRTHGIPDEVLTDNGKVFTGRFGLHQAEGPLPPHVP